MKRAITTTLAPNYEADDVRLALRLLGSPWRWRAGPAVRQLEQEFARWLPAKHAVGFASGRGALFAILQSLRLQPGEEVLLQAFTCVAVPGAVRWAGGRPVYVDIDPHTYTLAIADVERKITPRSRALIIQHTFGYAADVVELCRLARRHGLLVIEDCAHALCAESDGKRLGRFGDAAIFSFGRDKAISAVFGGLAVTNDPGLAAQLQGTQRRTRIPPRRWVVQQLLHPPLTFLAQRTLNFLGLGKVILRAGRIFHLLSLAIEPAERVGAQPVVATLQLPNALAVLALHQFAKRGRFSRHRAELAAYYQARLSHHELALPPESSLQRWSEHLLYTVRVPHAVRLLQQAARQGIHLGEWYRTVIAPHDVALDRVGYVPGSCPQAESAAQSVVNLPTHIGISLGDAKRVADFVVRATL